MRRVLGMLFVIILLFTLSCRAILPTPSPTPLPSSTLIPSSPIPLSLTPLSPASPSPVPLSPTPLSLASPSPIPLSPTPLSPTPSPIPFSPTPLSLTPLSPTSSPSFTVLYHPDDALYVGDQVSLEVIPPQDLSLPDAQLTVQVDPPYGQTLASAAFSPWGIAGRNQATLIWAWDTTALSPGEHTLIFSIHPQELSWEETVTLLPATSLPASEAGAHWASIQTTCCNIYYITNTASERDIQNLAASIDAQAIDATAKMHTDFSDPINLTILPRLLGHGGFASDYINVSYLDRNYASNEWDMVVHHEMIHILDGRLGGDLRPTILVEGLAVYMTGGHFKPEPLMPRAATLLDDELGLYIPLQPLTDQFYASQHEIGYLEAGALIEYMVNTWGWEAFSAFYRDIHPAENGSQSTAIDTALQAHFGLTFDQLEAFFLEALRSLPKSTEWREDVRLTVIYYDTMRRYQAKLDPSAYFRTAWLLSSTDMRQRNIVADYLRHPNAPQNLALETLLISAGEDMDAAPYTTAEQALAAVNAVLDAMEQQSPDPFAVHPLAADYYAIVQAVLEAGYQPQRIQLDGNTAHVQASADSPDLVELSLTRQGDRWGIPNLIFSYAN